MELSRRNIYKVYSSVNQEQTTVGLLQLIAESKGNTFPKETPV